MLAIDGPAGAGKSSTARAVAERLGFAYVDTGAMYRALAVAAARAGVPLESEPGLVELLERVSLRFDPAGRLLLDGEDVSVDIRSPEASRAASVVASHGRVRTRMVGAQRRLAEGSGSVVMEGRDIGTVVCPDTPIKVFLDADLAERARRRIRQQGLVPTPAELEKVKCAIAERDASDEGRADGPLRAADDAARIDTTGLSFDAQVQRVLAAVRARWPDAWGPWPGGEGKGP
ncbi:MAG: (d)CMP kinase [Candidatus Eisenbacteria bacterium]|nr:(d)CMP kinase [Candidatus Eisenbacteria bacterium]